MSDVAPEIVLKDDEAGLRYVATLPAGVAELELRRTNREGTLIAVHTGVPPNLRGTGVGRALVDRLVQDARNEGLQIIASCPFVKALFRRHPEWSDIMRAMP